MDILYRCCAGLDVHKQTVVACVRRIDAAGAVHQEVRTFGTMTCNLLALSDWLAEQEVTQAAMESTGVYWKPVFNILESRFAVLLVNAQHIKQVPGARRMSRTAPGSRSCCNTACSVPASCRRRRSGNCAT